MKLGDALVNSDVNTGDRVGGDCADGVVVGTEVGDNVGFDLGGTVA